MIPNSLDLLRPNPNDPDTLHWMAWLYSIAYSTGAWANEKHNADALQSQISGWITNSNNYRVVYGELNKEHVGFAVTRREPLSNALSSLFNELEGVSGITLSDDEKELVYSQLVTLLGYNSVEEFATKASSDLVGFFQDVVIEDRFRGHGYYTQLMLPLTMELLDDPNVRLIIVYTNPDVPAVVKTLEDFGGSCIHRGGVLVYAATTDIIKNKMVELGLVS